MLTFYQVLLLSYIIYLSASQTFFHIMMCIENTRPLE